MKPPSCLSITDQEILKRVYRYAEKNKIKLYLVGGYLRDILLQRFRENPDIDFCLKEGAIAFGRKFSRRLSSGFVILDKEHGACRVIKEIKKRTYTLDFTDFRGKTLEEDLLHRDFTINTLALELRRIFHSASPFDFLIDLYQARHDLKSRLIRAVNKSTFDEDPLRMLRAFSFACLFGFKIDKHTLRLIKLKKGKLSKVSFERIRDELFKIFDAPCAYDSLLQMDHLKLLRIIFPEIEKMRSVKQGPYHHLDVWQHTLEAVKQLELLMQELKNNSEIQDYLNEVISSERKRRALIKLGAFLHDIGKPQAFFREDGKIKFYGHERIGIEIAQGIAKRLKLSNDEFGSLKKMVYWHLRPGFLADNAVVTPRAEFRYFRDTGNEAVSILLLSIADQRATKGPLTTKKSRIHHEKIVFGLIREFFKKKKEKKHSRLINGNDLIKKFKLQPSVLIGKILRHIEELQAIGSVRTKKDAFMAAKKFIKANA